MDEPIQGTRGTPSRTHSGRRRLLHLLPPVIVLALLIDFVLQNTRSVPLHFLVWSGKTHVGWALLVAGILGVVAGVLAPRLRRFV